MNLNDLTKEEVIEKLIVLEEKYKLVKQRATSFLQKNQENRLYYSCRSNAKRKGVLFDLEMKDIIIPEKCIYLGCTLTNTSEQGRVWTNASVDRINSTKGYTKDNIQIISDLANRMKQNATESQLVLFAEGVLKIHVTNKCNKEPS
jgi:hypothetical protein